jgi:hypothetical protein
MHTYSTPHRRARQAASPLHPAAPSSTSCPAVPTQSITTRTICRQQDACFAHRNTSLMGAGHLPAPTTLPQTAAIGPVPSALIFQEPRVRTGISRTERTSANIPTTIPAATVAFPREGFVVRACAAITKPPNAAPAAAPASSTPRRNIRPAVRVKRDAPASSRLHRSKRVCARGHRTDPSQPPRVLGPARRQANGPAPLARQPRRLQRVVGRTTRDTYSGKPIPSHQQQEPHQRHVHSLPAKS